MNNQNSNKELHEVELLEQGSSKASDRGYGEIWYS